MITEHARLLVALPPFRAPTRTRTLLDCQTTDGAPSGGDCTGTDYRSPSYSPDGERIVFDAGARLAIIDADGGEAVLQPAATADDGDPCFSPDGKRIAFTGVNDHGGTDLYIRGLGGGAAHMIIHDAGEPAWSSREPARLRAQRQRLHRATRTAALAAGSSSGVSPDWSPNGRRLALVRPLPSLTFDGPTGRIYTVAASGRDLRRVGRSRIARTRSGLRTGAGSPTTASTWASREASWEQRARRCEVAPTQFSGESGSVSSFNPAWRPR